MNLQENYTPYTSFPAWLRKTFSAGVVALSLVLFLTPAVQAQPQYGGTLRLGSEIRIFGFDPVKTRLFFSSTAQAAGDLMLERLFNVGEKGEIIPVLGLSLDVSEDGKTYTIPLRQGVTFHDGTPFNADAVVNHFQRILDPQNRAGALLILQTIKSVEKVDEFTVRFHLAHPWKPFPYILASYRSNASYIPSPKAVAEGIQNRSPVGTGPFVFKSWKTDDRITVVRNEDYWQKGKPYLDQVTVRIIPDGETRYAALVAGEVDVLFEDRPANLVKLKADPNFPMKTGDGPGAVVLVMNTQKPPLDDARVRRALAYAWDQEKMIKLLYKDTVPFVTHWFGNALTCDNDSYRYPDLGKAKALIEEYGKPVEIEYIHSATQRGRDAAQIVQQFFKPIGVTVKAKPLEWGAIFQKMAAKDFNLASWGITGFDDMGFVTRVVFHSMGRYNMTGYASKTLDQFIVDQGMSLDQAERERIWCQIVKMVNDDAPHLILCGRRYNLFASQKVHDLPPPVNGRFLLKDVWLSK